jgi:outer membrane protein W
MEVEMRRWFIIMAVLFGIWIPLSAVPAQADDRHVSLGASLSAVTSTEGSLFGDRIKMERVSMPEAHLTYFITDSWSMEASYGRYETTIQSKNGGIDYGQLTVFPARLTLQYRHNYGHPPPYWDVASYYIGAGIGYFITNFDTDDEIRNFLADPNFKIKIKDSLGAHAAAGFDFFPAKAVSFSMELKYWVAQSDIKFQGASGAGKGHFDLNAWSIGAGLKFYL